MIFHDNLRAIALQKSVYKPNIGAIHELPLLYDNELPLIFCFNS